MTEKSILPPTYFFAALIVTLALHFLARGPAYIFFPLELVGIVPILFGAVLNVWADQIFKRRATTVKPYEKPSALISEGPFKWCRHPMYLGMVTILIGASLLCGSVVSLIGPVSFWLIIRMRFLPAEEKSMVDNFGDEYVEYKKRVGGWI